MKLKISIIAMLLFPQFLYAQEPKMEITLRDIYEELQTFKENNRQDMLEIKQTLARHDEQFKAIDQRFDAINSRLDTHLQVFLFAMLILAAILGFIFVKLLQNGERMSGLETLLTGDIKPAKQKMMEMAFKRSEDFKIMQNENRKLKEDVQEMQRALKKADIMT